jgi:hypothetical protein
MTLAAMCRDNQRPDRSPFDEGLGGPQNQPARTWPDIERSFFIRWAYVTGVLLNRHKNWASVERVSGV